MVSMESIDLRGVDGEELICGCGFLIFIFGEEMGSLVSFLAAVSNYNPDPTVHKRTVARLKPNNGEQKCEKPKRKLVSDAIWVKADKPAILHWIRSRRELVSVLGRSVYVGQGERVTQVYGGYWCMGVMDARKVNLAVKMLKNSGRAFKRRIYDRREKSKKYYYIVRANSKEKTLYVILIRLTVTHKKQGAHVSFSEIGKLSTQGKKRAEKEKWYRYLGRPQNAVIELVNGT